MFVVDSGFSYFTAFLIGFLGGVHCIGMCGSLVVILSTNVSRDKKKLLYLILNSGRLFSYVFIGFIASSLGFFLSDFFGENFIFGFKIFGGICVSMIGFYLNGFFNFLSRFEKIGLSFWYTFLPYIKKIMPIKSYYKAFIIGMFWGNLPCGLVYSALIWSVSFISIAKCCVLMLLFGVGTLPTVLASGYFAISLKKLIQYKEVRILSGVFMIFFGILTILRVIFFGNSCH